MDRWKRYLFDDHSESTLREWAKRMRYFRFVRSYGGHADNGDSLLVVYRYGRVEDLHRFFGYLDITLKTYSEKPPQPIAGVSYRTDEYLEFAALVPGTTWIEQPSHCVIAGQRAHAWCFSETLQISLGEDWRVEEPHVAAAGEIEELLADAPLERVEPPVDNEHCICPKYYPDFFR